MGPSAVPAVPNPASVVEAPPALTARSRTLPLSTTSREPSGSSATLSAALKRALAPLPSWKPAEPPPASPATRHAAGIGVGEGVGEGGAPAEGEALGVPVGEGSGHVSARSVCPDVPVSLTTSAPVGSNATPNGELKVASPSGPLALRATPVPANVASTPLSVEKARMRWEPRSATHSVAPSAESASPEGEESVPTPTPPSAV